MFHPDALGADTPIPKLVQNAFAQLFHEENIWGEPRLMATTPVGMGRRI